ncbi:MAG: stage II sporulation protein M [Chloroflexota bacterium]|nr:stage II sporulation protein M [Chloroflexota bacterium]
MNAASSSVDRPWWWPDYRQLLRLNWKWIAAAGAIFLFGCLVGFASARVAPERTLEVVEPVLSQLETLAAQVLATDSPLVRSGLIFANNARASVLTLLLGAGFGLVPLGVLLTNGSIIGLLIGFSTGTPLPDLPDLPRDPLFFAAVLLPHGIIELPAVLVVAAWGLKLGLAPWLPSAAGARTAIWRTTARESLQILVPVLVLLLVAAVIEANVTLALVQWLQG